jgi:sporadic carbohydrate cluster protein (TIGR04323 family)
MSIRKARGYIGSRMIERSVPQHIQNIIIRKWCEDNGFEYLLSATEYQMPGSTMILDSIQEEVIVFYSVFLMPEDRKKRDKLYGKEIYFAAENMKINRDVVELIYANRFSR